MSSEKRLVLFMVLTFVSFMTIQYVMDVAGLTPPPPPKAPQAKNQPKPGDAAPKPEAKAGADAAKDEEKGEAKDAEKTAKADAKSEIKPKRRVAPADPDELVIGSATDKAPGGYHLQVELEQRGAGVARVQSSRFDAEFSEGRNQKRRPLSLVGYYPAALPTLATNVRPAAQAKPDAAAAADEDDAVVRPAETTESPLAETLWEVVRDEKGRAVRPISEVDPKTKATLEGQQIEFQTRSDDPALVVTKRFRLWKGRDDFEMDLKLSSEDKTQNVVYRLFGPHSIPIEGEWYTGTFRDVFFGQVRGKATEIVTRTAAEVAKPKAPRFDNTTYPLKFAGIENQYFAVFVEPVPTPRTEAERRDSETVATVVHVDPNEPQKADVSVEILSKPITVGPNTPFNQTFRVFAGAKTLESLSPYGAEELVSYRKNQWFNIPGASTMARYVIAPLLDHIYNFTKQVAGLFGAKRGNYGVSIILLTLLVRLMMFPLGRKAAMAAKKMQDLQPLMKEIQEKYKDDKERQTRETLSLYKRHGVNPVGGCLPALIQLPIFVGLWQALNNSVHLRHASFLYIENLAAPDMLFRIPMQGGMPLLGQYFNLLPFLVVSLMLVQTKLFAPPATTPEQESQQKVMKFMMIFMGFMFYKVPSGLGLYFITSSLWQISERLLLPKVSHVDPTGDDRKGGGGGPGDPPGGGRGGNMPPGKPPGRLAQFWEKVKEEAAKDSSTHRNIGLPDDRDKGKPRAKPGRRR